GGGRRARAVDRRRGERAPGSGRAGQALPPAPQGAGPRGRRADRHPEGQAGRHRRRLRRPGRVNVRGGAALIELTQAVIGGLGQGAVYALLAVGFVIIFKSTRVISFAQPALMAAGATLIALL